MRCCEKTECVGGGCAHWCRFLLLRVDVVCCCSVSVPVVAVAMDEIEYPPRMPLILVVGPTSWLVGLWHL